MGSEDGISAANTDSPKLVAFLKTSSVLYEYLQTHPKSAIVPDILYWLSICDRAVNNDFFFSLADLYLRECILSYPTNPVAKKCFKEYETETNAAYTGSGGTHIPAEVKLELSRLKELVDPLPIQGKAK